MPLFAARLPHLSLRWRIALAGLALVLALGFLPASLFADPLLAPGCSHLVQRGDTLYSIAAKYGTTVAALVTTNNITNANVIWAGVTLKLPGCGATSTTPAKPAAPAQPAAPPSPSSPPSPPAASPAPSQPGRASPGSPTTTARPSPTSWRATT